MSSLPRGWVFASIGDVTVQKVVQGPPADDVVFNYVDISSVDNVAKQVVAARQIVGNQAPSRARQHLVANDVIVSMTRPNLNAVAKITSELHGSIGSTGFDVLRAVEIEPDWLFYTVRCSGFVRGMSDLVQGALYPAVRPEDIRSHPLPIPPLNEQRRIVVKLDALFEKSRAIRDKLDRVPRLLANLQKSILNAAFRGELTREWRAKNPNVEPASELLKRIRTERRAKWEADLIAKGKDPEKAKYVDPEPVNTDGLPELPEGWCWATLDLLSTKIVDGTHHTPTYISEGVPFISVKDIRNRRMSFDGCKFISQDEHDELIKRCNPEKGDLLITKSGTIGRTCVIEDDRPFSLFVSVALVKPVSDEIPALWISFAFEHWLNGINVANDITGSAIKNLHLVDIRRLVVPVAPSDEQREIIKRHEAVHSTVSSLGDRYRCLQKGMENAQAAFLAKAFRGELVPQDPTDEPASVLLDRIREQRVDTLTRRGRSIKAVA